MPALTQVASDPGYLEHLAENRYFDRTFQLEAAKVLPGEFYVTTTNMVIVTVLGSCVAACLRDRERGVGGMNHFMLPDNSDDLLSSSGRYGVYAMEMLVNQVMKLGARRNCLEAKVFGGARVLASMSQSYVGERNSEFVLNYLKKENIPLVAQDLLDIYPRKVYFFPTTGRVLVKKLVRVHNDTLVRRERDYEARLKRDKVSGDVELFG